MHVVVDLVLVLVVLVAFGGGIGPVELGIIAAAVVVELAVAHRVINRRAVNPGREP